ncbi:MAG: hypothetical protein V4676_11230 [Bacteroidota bacterium]
MNAKPLKNIKSRQSIFLSLAFCFIFFDVEAQPVTQDNVAKSNFYTKPASTKFQKPSFFKKIFIGRNYSEEWSTAVTVPVFVLSQTAFTIKELGGGQQTRSLQLLESNGREWALRSVDKHVEKVILPKGVPRGLILPIVGQMVSASHPYAAPVVYELARAAGIVTAKPTLVYVAEDGALGKYDSLFAGTLCFLELREPLFNGTKTKSTLQMMEDLVEDKTNRILQKKVLKARLLDMLVADWDRYEDQWRWATNDSGQLNFHYAIPRDRDQAFFHSNGLLVKMAGLFGAKQFVGFRRENLKLNRLNKKSFGFDRIFLSALDEQDWKETIDDFEKSITDSVIAFAVRQMPASIYALSGAEIERWLKSRRAGLKQQWTKYYKHLSGEVLVDGSDAAELFELSVQNNKLVVTVTDIVRNTKRYVRAFNADETYALQLNGFGGNDRFVLPASVSSSIKIKFNGGDGADVYELEGKIKNTIHENLTEKNQFIHTNGSSVSLE